MSQPEYGGCSSNLPSGEKTEAVGGSVALGTFAGGSVLVLGAGVAGLLDKASWRSWNSALASAGVTGAAEAVAGGGSGTCGALPGATSSLRAASSHWRWALLSARAWAAKELKAMK